MSDSARRRQLPSSDDARVREVRRLVAAHLPGHPADVVEPLGEGTDHVAYLVDQALIVRFEKADDLAVRAERVAREVRLLRGIARLSPLPVPVPAFADPDAGCMAYRKLVGVPLLHLPTGTVQAVPVACVLGEFLAALHAAPSEATRELHALVGTDLRAAAEWRAEAADTYAAVTDAVPAAHRAAVAAFLATAPPAHAFAHARPAFTHNDLGIEHVLVDPRTGAVSGIIDWSDAAVADPAADFGRLERDLGPIAVQAALDAYATSSAHALRPSLGALSAMRERSAFYARCLVLEDLAYGLETGATAYVDKSLAALAWLFPT